MFGLCWACWPSWSCFHLCHLPTPVQRIMYLKSGSKSTLVHGPTNRVVIQGSAVTNECTSNVSTLAISWHNSLCLKSSSATCNDVIYGFSGTVRHDPSRFNVTAVNTRHGFEKRITNKATDEWCKRLWVCVYVKRRLSYYSVWLHILHSYILMC